MDKIQQIEKLQKELQLYASDSQQYQNICQQISNIVSESDGKLQWVVDSCETVIH